VILVDAESGQSKLLEQLERAATQIEQSGWGRPNAAHVPHGEGSTGILAHLKPTALHNVLVFSGRDAGHERLSTLVPLAYWPEMVDHLHKVADVVIFDGPAALNGPDAGILAPLVDGSLLVLDGRQDSRSNAIKARKHLGSDNTSFLGAIVVRGTPNAKRKAPQQQPQLSSGTGLRVAVSRSGITITMGAAPEQPAVTAPITAAPRLLNPPDLQQQAAQPHNPDDPPLSWEDLVKIGEAAETAGKPATPPATVIITPPPDAPTLHDAAGPEAVNITPIPRPPVKNTPEAQPHVRRTRSSNSSRTQRTRVQRVRRKLGFDG
jgi:hypothetical protein